MNYLRKFKFLLIIRHIYCSVDHNEDGENIQSYQYRGEKFPEKYLVPEDASFKPEDLDTYSKTIKRTIDYFANTPNDTDANTGIGLFLAKSVLKRVMRDHGDSMSKHIRDDIKYSINKAEYVISHYAYMQVPYGCADVEFRLSRIFMYDESQIYSIAEYNRNKLKRWILSEGKIHDYLMEMDDGTLPREQYVKMAASMNEYFKIVDSDNCLLQLSWIPEPIDVTTLHPCRFDEPECHRHLHATPSFAYALSHRLLIVLARRQHRRCYIHSESVDDSIMDIMCAYMYREVVYIARRGFFARDLFLEHIALCSMLGYEEILRRSWFNKAISWVDDDEGCVTDSRNFYINSTRYLLEDPNADKQRLKSLRKKLIYLLNEPCHNHPTALFAVVMAHAIRYTLFKTKLQSKHLNT